MIAVTIKWLSSDFAEFSLCLSLHGIRFIVLFSHIDLPFFHSFVSQFMLSSLSKASTTIQAPEKHITQEKPQQYSLCYWVSTLSSTIAKAFHIHSLVIARSSSPHSLTHLNQVQYMLVTLTPHHWWCAMTGSLNMFYAVCREMVCGLFYGRARADSFTRVLFPFAYIYRRKNLIICRTNFPIPIIGKDAKPNDLCHD